KRPPNTSLATSRSTCPARDLLTCTLNVVTPLTSVKVTFDVESKPSNAALNASSELISPSSLTSSKLNPPPPVSMRRRRNGFPVLDEEGSGPSFSPACWESDPASEKVSTAGFELKNCIPFSHRDDDEPMAGSA